eukprot:COSAG02_NODE_7103_length_3185_cov_1.337006_1_plen_60_part_00
MAEELEELQRSRSGIRTENGSRFDGTEWSESSDESRISVSDLPQLEANTEGDSAMECVD